MQPPCFAGSCATLKAPRRSNTRWWLSIAGAIISVVGVSGRDTKTTLYDGLMGLF